MENKTWRDKTFLYENLPTKIWLPVLILAVFLAGFFMLQGMKEKIEVFTIQPAEYDFNK